MQSITDGVLAIDAFKIIGVKSQAVKGVTEGCVRNRLIRYFLALDASERAGVSGLCAPSESLRQPILGGLFCKGVQVCTIAAPRMEILADM